MSLRALIPFTLNAGLRRPRRGFTLVAGKEKLGVGKGWALVVVAEGAAYNAERLARHFRDLYELGFEARVTILGHNQRGGTLAVFKTSSPPPKSLSV